jgi:hypothetical protein
MGTMAWSFLALAKSSAVLPCEGFRIIRGRASFHRCVRAVRTVRMIVIPRVCSDWRDWRGCTGSSTAITSALSAEHSCLCQTPEDYSGNTGVRALGAVHTPGLARHNAAAGSYSTTGPI